MDLHVLSGGAAFGLVDGIKAGFENSHRCRIRGEFGAVGLMKNRLLAGEPCDAIILSRALIDQLAQDGKLIEGSARDLGVVSTGIATLAADPPPAITDEASFAAALRAASGIYVPDMSQSTAGLHMKRVFERLGVLGEIGRKIHEFPNGASAMKAMASGAVPKSLGCTQATEIMYTAGVKLAAPLPAGCALDTVYTIGIPETSLQPRLAGILVDALCDESLDDFKRNNGLSK